MNKLHDRNTLHRKAWYYQYCWRHMIYFILPVNDQISCTICLKKLLISTKFYKLLLISYLLFLRIIKGETITYCPTPSWHPFFPERRLVRGANFDLKFQEYISQERRSYWSRKANSPVGRPWRGYYFLEVTCYYVRQLWHRFQEMDDVVIFGNSLLLLRSVG